MRTQFSWILLFVLIFASCTHRERNSTSRRSSRSKAVVTPNAKADEGGAASSNGRENSPSRTPITPEPDNIDLSQWTYKDNGVRNDLYLTNNCQWNCQVLSIVCDYNATITRSFALQLAKRSPGEYNIGQVCEIYKYLRSRWRYVNDPRGREYLALASESIGGTKLAGDCDDFAILMYSVITAVGGKARINFAWNSSELTGHAYTEVFMTDFNESSLRKDIQKRFPHCDVGKIWYFEGNSGKWLNLDWTAEFPGGEYYEADERLRYFYDDTRRHWICE